MRLNSILNIEHHSESDFLNIFNLRTIDRDELAIKLPFPYQNMAVMHETHRMMSVTSKNMLHVSQVIEEIVIYDEVAS